MVSLSVTPSTVFAANSLVAWSSGKLIAAVAGTARNLIVGIMPKAIAATDDDYADDRKVPIIVALEKGVEVKMDVTSGLVAADVGLYQDLTDASTVDRSASSIDVVQCVRVLSTTEGIFRLNIGGVGQ